MPWISLDERAGPPGPHGGGQPSAQSVRCDLCSWETEDAYWGPKKARAEAGVWWPNQDEHPVAPGEDEPAWCPRCASHGSERARQSYRCTSLSVEATMSQYWRAPTGTSSPKAPPPGTSSQAHLEERLAALEEEMIRLRLRVAELEQHSSGAATG